MLLLSGYQLTRPALWADELATWGAVRLGWGGLFRLLGNVDAVVGPYLVLMKAWTGLAGTSTLALRLPSVFAMTVATALLAILGARLAGRRVGLLAGLAFALVPTTSRYAQEARPYAFAILFAVLATLVLTWLLDRPGWLAGAAYALSVALLGAAHLIAVLLLVAHGIFVSQHLGWISKAALAVSQHLGWISKAALAVSQHLGRISKAALAVSQHLGWISKAALAVNRHLGWISKAALAVGLHRRLDPAGGPARRDRRTATTWAVAAGIGVLPLLPLAWLGHRQSAQISWLTAANWRTLVAVPDTVFGAGVVGGFLIVIGLLGWSRKPPAVLAAAWALAPTLALYLVSEVTTLFWARYLLFTLPGFVLLAALTLGRLSRPRAAALLVVLALLAVPAQTGIRTPDGHNHATTEAAGIIAANERGGDGIAYALNEPVVPWEARDIVARYVPAGKQPRDVFAVTPQRVAGRLTATECPDLPGCLGSTPRLWVLRYQNLADPLAGIGQPKEDLLRQRYRLDKLWLVRGLTVALYVRA